MEISITVSSTVTQALGIIMVTEKTVFLMCNQQKSTAISLLHKWRDLAVTLNFCSCDKKWYCIRWFPSNTLS